MHNIDQREIEYLELLTRLTQLFSVKTSLEAAEKHEMRFPALTWVVQAFVMEFEGETAKEWLEGLLAARGLEEGAARGLQHIFSSIDCKALFVPTMRSKRLLAHLNEADDKALTKEYIDDLTDLRASITASLKAKEALNHVSTGRQIASLLELVVNSANNGTLAKVPSMWTNFLKIQVEEAKSTSLSLQSTRLGQYDALAKPLSVSAYADKITVAIKEAAALYDKILVGLQFAAVTSGKASLKLRLEEQGRYKAVWNEKRIRTYLQLETDSTYAAYKQNVDAIKLPLPRRHLAESEIAKLTAEAEEELKQTTADYADVGIQIVKNRMLECRAHASHTESTNGKLLDRISEEAMSSGLKRYGSVMETLLRSRGDGCVVDKSLAGGDVDATKQGMAAFEGGLGVTRDEDKTPKFRSDTQSSLRGLLTSFTTRNNLCIKSLAEKVRKTAVDDANRSLLAVRLPMSETALKTAISQQESQRNREYDDQMTEFQSSVAVSKERTKLNEGLGKEAKRFRDANVREVKRLVRDPLEDVEEEMKRHVHQYWTTWSFKKDCRQIALKKIKRNGGLSTDLDAFVGEAIEDWIDNEMGRYTAQLEMATKAMMITPLIGIGGLGYFYLKLQQGQQQQSYGTPA